MSPCEYTHLVTSYLQLIEAVDLRTGTKLDLSLVEVLFTQLFTNDLICLVVDVVEVVPHNLFTIQSLISTLEQISSKA